jgi:predicted MPP superfamily phosphohydrolase
MSSKFALFLAQAVIVLLIVAFHSLVAWRLMVRAKRWSPPRARLFKLGLVVAVAALDLPLAHLFLIYKYYNPLFLDRLLHGIAAPFLAMHANALILGGLLLTRDFMMRPIGRWMKSKRTRTPRRRAAVTAAETTHDAMPMTAAASPGAAVPAGTADSTIETMAEETVERRQGRVRPRLLLPRRRFLQTSALAATGIVTSASTLSAMKATGEYRLERIVMKVPNLPEALKGTTIAIISDIHSSVFMTRDEMERYAREVNNLKADMIFVLGDFVNSKLREVYPFAEAFDTLHAPYGVYGITGNHDYYTGEIETVCKEVSQAGIRLLRNENLAIEKNGEKLWLLGIDDGDVYDVKPYIQTGRSPRGTIENMMKGVPEGAPKLFLCHKPYPFEEYSQLGLTAMFSGHTHGGQVVIAQLDNINLSFASLASRYVAGLYRSRTNPAAQLYVTRGVGTVGIPLRLNCPPELTHVVLV